MADSSVKITDLPSGSHLGPNDILIYNDMATNTTKKVGYFFTAYKLSRITLTPPSGIVLTSSSGTNLTVTAECIQTGPATMRVHITFTGQISNTNDSDTELVFSAPATTVPAGVMHGQFNLYTANTNSTGYMYATCGDNTRFYTATASEGHITNVSVKIPANSTNSISCNLFGFCYVSDNYQTINN